MGKLVAVVEAEPEAPAALAVRDDHVGESTAPVGQSPVVGRLIFGVSDFRDPLVVRVLLPGHEALEVLLNPRIERRLPREPVRARRDRVMPACGLAHDAVNRQAVRCIPGVRRG